MDTFSDDSFSDDDIDIAAELQKTQTQHHQSTTTQDNGGQDYQLQGQVAVLENQLEQLRRSYLQREEELKQRYEEKLILKEGEIKEQLKELKEKDDQLDHWKDKDEFKAIDGSLNSIKKRKLNNEHSISLPTAASTPSRPPPPQRPHLYTPSSSLLDTQRTITKERERERERVMVLNQTSWYEDERSVFTESISNYLIPGTPKPVLDYLADITSKFDYEYRGFQMSKEKNTFKSIILKFLIEFDDKHRIDLLISNFIHFLFDYISHCISNGGGEEIERGGSNSLLQAIFLLSLINFSLSYRPKAISDELIQFTTREITKILSLYPDIISSEINYLSTSDSRDIMEYIQSRDDGLNMMDYSFLEKPIHIKILEVFTVIFSSDILRTLSSLASFRMENFINCKAANYLWTNIQPKLFYTFLQPLTTFHFILNAIEMLISSTFNNDNFAYTYKKDRNGENINNKIMRNLISLFDEGLNGKQSQPQNMSQNRHEILLNGLSQSIGNDNHFIKLLDLSAPLSGELSSIPRTHPYQLYNEILMKQDRESEELKKIQLKIRLLDLFEILLVLNESVNHIEFHDLLFEKLCNLINDEQLLIYQNHRSPNIDKRILIICKSITLVRFLINDLKYVIPIPSLNSKKLIMGLLRISSNNMREISYNFLKNLRLNKYKGPVFNCNLEMGMLDKFGGFNLINNEMMRLELESELCNGVEFNYPQEIIDTCKDMLIEIMGEQECDKLLSSINYDLSDFDVLMD